MVSEDLLRDWQTCPVIARRSATQTFRALLPLSLAVKGLEKLPAAENGGWAEDCQFEDWGDWGGCQLQPCGPALDLDGRLLRKSIA